MARHYSLFTITMESEGGYNTSVAETQLNRKTRRRRHYHRHPHQQQQQPQQQQQGDDQRQIPNPGDAVAVVDTDTDTSATRLLPFRVFVCLCDTYHRKNRYVHFPDLADDEWSAACAQAYTYYCTTIDAHTSWYVARDRSKPNSVPWDTANSVPFYCRYPRCLAQFITYVTQWRDQRLRPVEDEDEDEDDDEFSQMLQFVYHDIVVVKVLREDELYNQTFIKTQLRPEFAARWLHLERYYPDVFGHDRFEMGLVNARVFCHNFALPPTRTPTDAAGTVFKKFQVVAIPSSIVDPEWADEAMCNFERALHQFRLNKRPFTTRVPMAFLHLIGDPIADAVFGSRDAALVVKPSTVRARHTFFVKHHSFLVDHAKLAATSTSTSASASTSDWSDGDTFRVLCASPQLATFKSHMSTDALQFALKALPTFTRREHYALQVAADVVRQTWCSPSSLSPSLSPV